MPPRKTAVAGDDDECPTLKLIMEKGPLSGQTNYFKPRTRIRIGRLLRGNTLSIKDDGISSKHLLIEVDAGGGGWVVTDLDSSNGTLLNGELLEPAEPAVLSDGDVIKIGEETSIKVKFEAIAGETKVNASRNVRRNARSGVRKQVGEMEVIDEDSELGLGIENENNLGHGRRNEKIVDLGIKGCQFEAVDEEIVRGRRNCGWKAKELEHVSEEKTESMGIVSSRMKRNSEKDENLKNLIQHSDDKTDEVTDLEVKEVKSVLTRRTRNAKNNENLSKELNLEVNNNLEPSGMKCSERVRVRRTRSSRKEANIDDPFIDLSVLESKMAQKGTSGRKKIPRETPLDVKEKEELNSEEQKSFDEVKVVSEVGVGELLEREASEGENANAFASTSGVKQNGVGVGIGEVVEDLEKMTLGEWFEFLEVYLPKQIIDETEHMISEMRKKAERLHEFMLQQKNGKSAMNID